MFFFLIGIYYYGDIFGSVEWEGSPHWSWAGHRHRAGCTCRHLACVYLPCCYSSVWATSSPLSSSRWLGARGSHAGEGFINCENDDNYYSTPIIGIQGRRYKSIIALLSIQSRRCNGLWGHQVHGSWWLRLGHNISHAQINLSGWWEVLDGGGSLGH